MEGSMVAVYSEAVRGVRYRYAFPVGRSVWSPLSPWGHLARGTCSASDWAVGGGVLSTLGFLYQIVAFW